MSEVVNGLVATLAESAELATNLLGSMVKMNEHHAMVHETSVLAKRMDRHHDVHHQTCQTHISSHLLRTGMPEGHEEATTIDLEIHEVQRTSEHHADLMKVDEMTQWARNHMEESDTQTKDHPSKLREDAVDDRGVRRHFSGTMSDTDDALRRCYCFHMERYHESCLFLEA